MERCVRKMTEVLYIANDSNGINKTIESVGRR